MAEKVLAILSQEATRLGVQAEAPNSPPPAAISHLASALCSRRNNFAVASHDGAPPEYTGHSSNLGEAPTRPLTRGSLEQLEQQQMAYALEASRAEEAERAAAERSAGGGGGGGGGFNPDNRSSVSAASDRPSVTLEMPPSTMSPVGRGSVVATEQAMSQDV